MGEGWFTLGCLLFPLSALSGGQASACVQDNHVSLEGWFYARCPQSGHLPALLCPCPPERTAGGVYTLPLGSLGKEHGGQNRAGLVF